MTREEIIPILGQYIKRMEFAQADPQVNPKWEDQQFIDDALQEAKNLLERIKAGDDGAIQEASDLLEGRSKKSLLLQSYRFRNPPIFSS